MARHSIRTLYLDGMVYQQTDTITNPGGATDTLQFIGHEEGRVCWAYHTYTAGPPGYAYAYDFFEKDHLGNTRMVLTQERDTTIYIATMEAAYRTTESQLFGNIASTSYAWNSMPGEAANIPSSTRYPPGVTVNDSVSQVTGNVGQTTGPSLLLKVMAGDTIMPGVQCYYVSNTLTTTNSSFNAVLSSLATAITGTPTGGAEGILSNYTSSSGTVYSGLTTFLSTKDPAAPSGYPKAYLNWILLDDQFNYVSSSSGSVAAANTAHPPNQMNPVASGSPIVMARNGYLYVWVSNETQGWSVFFDNFSVQYKQGPVLEENHYYPFGLTMAGISDKAVKTSYAENKYRFNKGSELQNKEFSDGSGLEMYETKLRELDPQLGRWWQIDPKTDEDHESESPYRSMDDDPARYNDPNGDEGEGCCEVLQSLWDNTVRGAEIVGSLIKDAVRSAGDNFDKRWAAGVTLPQQFFKDPMSAVTGFEGVPIEAPGAATGDIIKTTEEVKAVEATKTADQIKASSPYADLKEPNKVGEGLETTKAQRARILEANKERNGGVIKSDKSEKVLDPPTQSKKGVPANMNQAEIDHVKAKSNGGSNSNSNLQVLSKKENIKKSNKPSN